MKLRIFLPATDRLDPAARIPWRLFDGRQETLRQEATPLADLPRVDGVEAIVPAERVLFARLKLPRVNAATIRELLPYAVEDRLLADPAHIHAVAGRTNAAGETIVAVVDREWLGGMVDALARAGVRPRHAWAEGALLAGGKQDWHVVWAPMRGMLVDDEGVGVTFDHGAGDELPLALRIALDEASSRGDKPRVVRVHRSGEAPLPAIAAWADHSGIAFEEGSSWETVSAGAPAAGSIDLLQGGFARRPGAGLAIPRAAVALAAVIALLQLGFTAWDAWRLSNEKATLEAKRESVFRAAFPEAKVVVDPDLQMARNRAELERARGLASGDGFLVRLTEAGRGSTAPVKSVTYANGKLEVKR